MKNGKIERLYFSFLPNTKFTSIKTWFEIVNDKITPCVSVSRYGECGSREKQKAEQIKADIYHQFREIINNCELERKETPLNERLRDDITPIYDDRNEAHQVEALRFLCSMKVSALNGDVGTMKSKIAIDLCASRYNAGQIKKVLVFLPVATKQNFREQIDLWCNCREIEWKLIGHETMGSSPKAVFEALKFVDNRTQVIIDESHLIKNPIAKRSKRIKMVCDKTSYKLVMTGTPISENVHNLYMQYAVLSDSIINVPSWLKFEEKYLIIGGRSGGEVIGYKNLDHLLGLIEPYTFQISASVLSMKPKEYHRHYCELNYEQEFLYNLEKDKLLEIIQKGEVQATDIFKTFTRMQQITSGYYSNRKGKINIGTRKIELIKELGFPEKTIFFCKYVYDIDSIKSVLGHENCAEFSGRNIKTRDFEKDLFVKGDKKYFVATMQSGGTGLNGLQLVSNNVCFYSNSFSYLQRVQSIGRLDRKGQEKEVHVWDITTNAKIENRIMNCLSRKQNLTDEIKDLLSDKMKLKRFVESL